MNKYLSIIIPVYNIGNYLKKCLDSIYENGINEDEFEVILINDGSTDNSIEIATSYKSAYTNLLIFDQINSGVSIARNKGIEISHSPYITFVDGDDWLIEGSLKQIIEFVKHLESQVDVAYFRSFVNTKNNEYVEINMWTEKFREDEQYSSDDLQKGHYMNNGSVWGAIYRKDFIVCHNLMFGENVANGEDVIFNYLLYSNKPSFVFKCIPYYVVFEREGSASRSNSLKRVSGFKNNIMYLKKIHNSSNISVSEKHAIDASLYYTISAATNMYIKLGEKDWHYLYELLGISSIWKMNVPWLHWHQRFKIIIINYSFHLYFKLLQFFKS